MKFSNIEPRSGSSVRAGANFFAVRFASLILIAGAAAFWIACASVRPIPAPAADPILPEMRLLAGQGSPVQDAEDFKLRKTGRPAIQLVLHNDASAGGLPGPLRDIAFLKMAHLLKFPDVKLVTPPAQVAADLGTVGPTSRKYLAELQADAVASIQVQTAGEDQAKVALRLLDPVTGDSFGEFVQNARIVKRVIDPAHQAEFFRDRAKRRVEFLEAGQSPQLEFTGDGKSSVRDLVLRSVTANLSVQSSSPETEVVLIAGDKKRRALGSVPISGERLREGLYRLELKRPGYEAIAREIQIRAGRDRDLFITWPDDQGASSLSVLSAPPGQRVSMDGTIRGRTPLYITSIDPGSYSLEVSRSMEGQGFEVVGESAVEVAGGQNAGRVFFTRYDESFTKDLMSSDYWSLSAEAEGVKPEFAGDGGLAFRLQPGSATQGRLGLTSRPMVTNSFDMTLVVRQAAGNALTFGLVNQEQETILVRISGKVYTLERFTGGSPVAPLSFETIKQREGNLYPVRFRYDKVENRLQVEIDGDVVYEGPYNSGGAASVVLWTDAESADGRELARSLRIRSGRGLYDD
ncbi:MAG: PEGA domain-containing protein [bacterium]|nr:PEGA domain-containing protein [bacterium]